MKELDMIAQIRDRLREEASEEGLKLVDFALKPGEKGGTHVVDAVFAVLDDDQLEEERKLKIQIAQMEAAEAEAEAEEAFERKAEEIERKLEAQQRTIDAEPGDFADLEKRLSDPNKGLLDD